MALAQACFVAARLLWGSISNASIFFLLLTFLLFIFIFGRTLNAHLTFWLQFHFCFSDVFSRIALCICAAFAVHPEQIILSHIVWLNLHTSHDGLVPADLPHLQVELIAAFRGWNWLVRFCIYLRYYGLNRWVIIFIWETPRVFNRSGESIISGLAIVY